KGAASIAWPVTMSRPSISIRSREIVEKRSQACQRSHASSWAGEFPMVAQPVEAAITRSKPHVDTRITSSFLSRPREEDGQPQLPVVGRAIALGIVHGLHLDPARPESRVGNRPQHEAAVADRGHQPLPALLDS